AGTGFRVAAGVRCALRSQGRRRRRSRGAHQIQRDQAMNSKISYAVAAILGGSSCAAYAAEPATGGTEAVTGALEEITVTAQRRTQNIQDVPISMQALTEQTQIGR